MGVKQVERLITGEWGYLLNFLLGVGVGLLLAALF
jgi:hypothetical protein